MSRSGRYALLSSLAIGLVGLAGLVGWHRTASPPMRLLLVTVDTLRADRLGCYGQRLPLTPNLDRLASEGALLEQVVVPVPRTTQSTASLLTGLHPVSHGVRGLFWRLPENAGRTLAEILLEKGFETAAFTSNLFLRPGQGFERGFRLYDNPPARWERNGSAEIVDNALDWIGRRHKSDSGWFVWLHFLDPHWSYEPPSPYDRWAGGVRPEDLRLFRDVEAGRVAKGDIVFGQAVSKPQADRLRRLYDGEVAATDAALGHLREGLKRMGLLDGTLLVVTADHGESLGEHGYSFAHGEFLYEETLRVPAIIRLPGTIPAGRRPHRLVRNFDLMPTILELLQMAPPAGLDGISRAAELRGAEESDSGREIYIESDRQYLLSGNPKRFLPGYEGSWRAIRDENWKMIRIPRTGGDLIELYDMRTDPAEQRDLSGHLPPEAAGLASRLARWEELASQHSGQGSQEPSLDEQQLQTLRSLGYANPPPQAGAGP